MNKLDFLGYAAIVIIFISLISLATEITGRATDTSTGTVNVTIETSASINFTTNAIDFGTGQVTAGQSSAEIVSNNTDNSTNGNWSWVSSNYYLVVENDGNANLTVNLSADKDANSFIGGSSPSANFAYINNEASSCTEGDVAMTVWNPINTTGGQICDPLVPTDTSDSINISVQLVIPSDATAGTKTLTFTATGISA